jgi:hypothetical protein
MTDGIVLAENAAEIAVGEKNGPRAMKADKRALFAEMRRAGGDLGEMAGAADSLFPFEPVDVTIAGADGAAFENLKCFLYFSLEKPFAKSAEINGLKVRCLHRSLLGFIRF